MLMGMFASQSPGFQASTPRRSIALAVARRSSARRLLTPPIAAGAVAFPLFLGFRLDAIFAPDGTPRALELTLPKVDERDVALMLLARCQRQGGEVLLGDKGYASRAFAAAVNERAATFVRPRRKDEAGQRPHPAPIRQRIESIFWTCKDLLTLERHGAAPSLLNDTLVRHGRGFR